jgi:Outer membrane lipoprotein-sorting protein
MKNTIVCALFFSLATLGLGQTAEPSITNADEVMAKTFAQDGKREAVSQGYAGSRRYVFENGRLHKHAELLVTVKCDPDGSKHFEVVSEEGWKTANHKILRKMLESEAETSQPLTRPKSRLTPDNYSFSLVERDSIEGRPMYVIDVTPKRSDKYLFEGRIWVDANDYALVRVEGKPAKNPSFWTRSIHFVHQYQKRGDFWFPTTTESITQARLVGKTEVTIQYFDYAPNTAGPNSSPTHNLALTEAKYVQH